VLCLCLGCESEQQARERLERSDFEAARQKNTSESYAAFLKAHPGGVFAADARERRTLLEWDAAKAANTRTAFRLFARNFPSSPFSEEAALRGRDFLAKVVGVGKVDAGPGDRLTTGPIVEVTPQWEERAVVLDRESVHATGADGKRIELACLVPVEPERMKLRIEPYPDRVSPDGRYNQTTVIPGENTFTKRNVNVFCTEGQTFFKVEIPVDGKPTRLGLVYGADYKTLKTVSILGHTFTGDGPAK
jgi:hypothetical protein